MKPASLVTVAFWCPAGVHDWLLQNYRISIESVYVLPLTGIGVFSLFLFLVTRRYIAAIRRAEQAQHELEHQLREREAELTTTYERLRTVEREQILGAERQRLMQDMHDGLGTKLLVSLNALKDASVDRDTAVTLLRDCLDELRLTVDAYDQDSGDLAAILAAVRYRLGDRLAASGIAIDWQVAETPPLPSLTRAGGRELMRIVQEAFTNAIRHSGGRTLGVASRALTETREVELTLSDDGQGFDPTLRGEGLQRIERIARQLGARGGVRRETPRLRVEVAEQGVDRVHDDGRAAEAAIEPA